MDQFGQLSPLGPDYFFPAEWSPHRATWLSWPHKEASWPGKIDKIFLSYVRFIKEISKGETVCINVVNSEMESFAKNLLFKESVDLGKINFYTIPTNDAWCRDHGPAFLLNKKNPKLKVVVSWLYNAWGNKYPPFDLDIRVPSEIAKILNLPILYPNIIMEGGSVDFNGEGTVLSTTSCLLNSNRNPNLNQSEIERYLQNFYGIEQVLWLGDGIAGDDTDGHIDDITRFVGSDKVITMVEPNIHDENYGPLKTNLKTLKNMKLINGKSLDILEIEMPSPVYYDGIRLPASYANFYISNHSVIVPTFNDPKDQKAIDILTQVFADRNVLGIDSTDIIWGLGSFHCLSQQEPL